MIHARDWLIFIKNGVPLEDLPMSEEHRDFCLAWLKKRKAKPARTVFDLRREADSVKATFDLESYPPKVFKRAELWTDYDAQNDAYSVWKG